MEAILVDYLQCIFLMRGTSEAALFVLFDFGLYAHEPLSLESSLADPYFPLPLSFIFGKHDWVSGEGSHDVINANQYKSTGESQLHVVAKAGHDLASDNPDELAKLIIGDLNGTISHKHDSKRELYYLTEEDMTDASLVTSKSARIESKCYDLAHMSTVSDEAFAQQMIGR